MLYTRSTRPPAPRFTSPALFRMSLSHLHLPIPLPTFLTLPPTREPLHGCGRRGSLPSCSFLSDLPPLLHPNSMAIDAVTASLVLTAIVHANSF